MKTLKMSRFRLAIIYTIGIMLIVGCEKDSVLNLETSPISDEITSSVLDKTLAVSSDSLTDEEILSLMFMVEEEKLARDVYLQMLDLYALKIFDHISQSETRHMEAVSNLIVKYELENPITDNPIGVFVNEELQLLYNDLIVMGSVSKTESLNVGVIIEETDLEDIQVYLDLVVVNKDIEQVYTHLLNGSASHLASFVKKLE